MHRNTKFSDELIQWRQTRELIERLSKNPFYEHLFSENTFGVITAVHKQDFWSDRKQIHVNFTASSYIRKPLFIYDFASLPNFLILVNLRPRFPWGTSLLVNGQKFSAQGRLRKRFCPWLLFFFFFFLPMELTLSSCVFQVMSNEKKTAFFWPIALVLF